MTQRDKVLALLLPALVVVAGYGWFFSTPKMVELTRARKSREDAIAKAPGVKKEVAQTRVRVMQLTVELQQLEARKKTILLAWESATGKCPVQQQRNERIEQLTGLLKRRGLSLVDDGEADAGKDGKLNPGLEALVKQMSETSPQHKPQLRRIHLKGRYLDLLGALEELAASKEVLAIPVGVSLKEDATLDNAVREWLLLVWI